MRELTIYVMWWLICLWWNDHADGIGVDAGVELIVCEFINRVLLPLPLCSMIEICLLFLLLPLDHSFFPFYFLSIIDTCRCLLVRFDSGCDGFRISSSSSSSHSYSTSSTSSSYHHQQQQYQMVNQSFIIIFLIIIIIIQYCNNTILLLFVFFNFEFMCTKCCILSLLLSHEIVHTTVCTMLFFMSYRTIWYEIVSALKLILIKVFT